jgi:hypothetical protein
LLCFKVQVWMIVPILRHSRVASFTLGRARVASFTLHGRLRITEHIRSWRRPCCGFAQCPDAHRLKCRNAKPFAR